MIPHGSPSCNIARFTFQLRLKLSHCFVKLQTERHQMAAEQGCLILHVEQSDQYVPLITVVRMSAVCLAVLTSLIWIPGPRLILSRNQSSATRCVGGKRVSSSSGLGSLMIFLITASLSSKTNGRARCRESVRVEERRQSSPVGDIFLFFMHGNPPAWRFSCNQSPCPPSSAWDLVPIKEQPLARFSILRCCRVKRLSASRMSEQLVQVCNDEKCRTLRPK